MSLLRLIALLVAFAAFTTASADDFCYDWYLRGDLKVDMLRPVGMPSAVYTYRYQDVEDHSQFRRFHSASAAPEITSYAIDAAVYRDGELVRFVISLALAGDVFFVTDVFFDDKGLPVRAQVNSVRGEGALELISSTVFRHESEAVVDASTEYTSDGDIIRYRYELEPRRYAEIRLDTAGEEIGRSTYRYDSLCRIDSLVDSVGEGETTVFTFDYSGDTIVRTEKSADGTDVKVYEVLVRDELGNPRLFGIDLVNEEPLEFTEYMVVEYEYD